MIIPPEFLSMLRSGSLLREVMAEHVTLAKVAPNTWKGTCPFCASGKSGDCKITVFENSVSSFYHCFSDGLGPSCGAHGDSVGGTMRLKNLSKDDAFKYLAARLGLEVPPEPEPVTEVPEDAIV